VTKLKGLYFTGVRTAKYSFSNSSGPLAIDTWQIAAARLLEPGRTDATDRLLTVQRRSKVWCWQYSSMSGPTFQFLMA